MKYEAVDLKACQNASEGKRGIGDYLSFYNEKRRHQALDRLTPEEVCATGFARPEAG